MRLLAALAIACLLLAACGSSTSTDDASPAAETEAFPGVRLVTPEEGDTLRTDDDVIVLDVRTAEEFAAGHLADAVMIDFHGDDFEARIGELDPDARYVLYCRSGNRSGQTRALMTDLGFTDVADVDGGILAWEAAGLPLVVP